jgi:pimeloyl-ACP methyl ester carboxylesterase
MRELERPDGAKIHYEVRGEAGPTVVLASYWTWTPGVFGKLFDRLAADHRVVTYHLRGTGDSSRRGPYDTETDCGDLEALLEEVGGGPAVALALADGSNRAVRIAARRPDLIGAVACVGTLPLNWPTFQLSEAMVSSEQTVGALQGLMESNYRAAVRHMTEAVNPQLDEEGLRERVNRQVEFCPGEVALARQRAWQDDDPEAAARELGDRLWVLLASGAGGDWLPGADEMKSFAAKLCPQAQFEWVEPGLESNPELGAEVLARIAAPLGAAAAQSQK